MTSEEVQNFNIDNKDIKIAKDFDYLVLGINSNEGCSQEIKIRLNLRSAAMEELGNTIRAKIYYQRPRLKSSVPSYSQLPCKDVEVEE